MEGNNDISLVGDDALGYLAVPIYKKYSITFAWVIQLVRSLDVFSPQTLTTFWYLIHFPVDYLAKHFC